jgi:hypothetical protein
MSRLDDNVSLAESMAGCLAVERLLPGWLMKYSTTGKDKLLENGSVTSGKWANVPLGLSEPAQRFRQRAI